ncbi:MAG: tRNA-dihydrouridine synthase family protein [Chloroflexi bacterium]|nr:tRNA-dihydrouridine synthase family protein [Chloroflexota bacterium]
MTTCSAFPRPRVPRPPSFYVREVPVYGDVVLAPMDGITDPPFRALGRLLGSAMAYTEFIHAVDVLQRPQWVWRKVRPYPWEAPLVVQLYGHTVNMLVEAALRVQDTLGPAIIDINMGCPDPRIVRRGAGAGMLRSPLKIARLFRRLTRILEVPVTAKIRLGLDDTCKPYRLVARILEENGAALIAVHGRTQAQGYRGQADWEAIREIAALVRIPVLGNGDVRTPEDIEHMKRTTGVAGVMIGRAALANPWILARCPRDAVPPRAVWHVLRWHLQENLRLYGLQRGLVLFRKFAARYLAPYPAFQRQRRAILTLDDPARFLDAVAAVLFESP